MKIALFGASGRTGVQFLKHANGKHFIKALVRKPEEISGTFPTPTFIKGDILNFDDVLKTISGVDVVISLIGHVKDSPDDLQTLATRNILDAMEKSGVKRLISLTGGGVRDQAVDQPRFMDKMVVFIMKHLAGRATRKTLDDAIEHARLIRLSNTQWTIVRAPMLTNEPAKGTIDAGNIGFVKGFKLTREDLAVFIINEMEENNYVAQMPFLTNGK